MTGKVSKEVKETFTRTDSGVLLEKLDNEVLLVNQLKHRMLQDVEQAQHQQQNTTGNDSNRTRSNSSEPKEKIEITLEQSSQQSNSTSSIRQHTVNDELKEPTTDAETTSQETVNNKPETSKSTEIPEGEPEDETWLDNPEFYKNIDTKTFRQYELACHRVKQFYEEQHEKQTVAYNIQARINFKTKTRAKMSIWEGLERLNKLLDDSDPDTELSQIDHALQTAEAIRRDKKPRWFQLVGLIHDLGKLLYFFDSKGQWDVVGDTFPVGCKFLKKIILPNSFSKNPDFFNPLYNTKYGIYSKHCGLDKVMLSWGHDEYMYHIAKENSTLPPEALAMIRYHSFYPWHQDHAYSYLMDEHDKEMLKAVTAFNKYDLYSKIDSPCDVEKLKLYYLELIDEYFPNKIIEF
jgi:inositol oxygenase